MRSEGVPHIPVLICVNGVHKKIRIPRLIFNFTIYVHTYIWIIPYSFNYYIIINSDNRIVLFNLILKSGRKFAIFKTS